MKTGWRYYTIGDGEKLRTELEYLKKKGTITHYRLETFLVDGTDVDYWKACVRLHPRNGGPMLQRIEQERVVDRMVRVDVRGKGIP